MFAAFMIGPNSLLSDGISAALVTSLENCSCGNRLGLGTSASCAIAMQTFPQSYEDAIKQAQEAVSTALKDGCKLIEVEFPAASLSSVPGGW